MTSAPPAMAVLTWVRTSSIAARRASPPPATSKRPSTAKAREAGRAAVLVDVDQLGQVVVVDDRHGEDDLAARLGGGLEQIRLGPERATSTR